MEDVYAEAIIEKIDIPDIRDILEQFTLEHCKVVLMGN